MELKSVCKIDDKIYRIVAVKEDKVLAIDCKARVMPVWYSETDFSSATILTADDIQAETCFASRTEETLSPEEIAVAHRRFNIIASILPHIDNEKHRSEAIRLSSETNKVSKQTIRHYLCTYLVADNIAALAPPPARQRELTTNEKFIRRALNKYYYTSHQNSLKEAYLFMLKESFTDENGVITDTAPSFTQFTYFYRRHKKEQTQHISREGLTGYQKHHRPLLGSITDYAPAVGTAMLDSTICDIYLIDEGGELIGRPILTAAIDAYSSLCLGYALTMDGGIPSIRKLFGNIICNKREWCHQFGVNITDTQWPASGSLPGVMVTDNGTEYTGYIFEQLTDLGCSITNLPPFRPDLKCRVEKFFDIIQNAFKPYLRGKGVIHPDFQERGAPDYRDEACLTLKEFETIILHCIVFYNASRLLENFPYTEEMLKAEVAPNAAAIFNWGKDRSGANLIPVDNRIMTLTLLPRTKGQFTRYGLIVNKLRYRADGYNERYLSGGEVAAAFNPDDVSTVWLIEKGEYIPFSLIEKRFEGLSVDEVCTMKNEQTGLVESAKATALQAKVDLANQIEAIVKSRNEIKRKLKEGENERN